MSTSPGLFAVAQRAAIMYQQVEEGVDLVILVMFNRDNRTTKKRDHRDTRQV